MKINTIIYVISDLNGVISKENIEKINNLTELNFEGFETVTYQMLIDARRNSMEMAYGYPMFKNGVKFWVLPSLPMGLIIYNDNDIIKEYYEQDYKKNILPFWDIEEIEDI